MFIICKIYFSEEDFNLPLLENAITPDRNSSLAQSFEQTKNSNDLK